MTFGTLLLIVVGVGFGALGGAWHLAVTRWRARRLTSTGGTLAVWLALPLGLLGPALAVWAAAQLAASAAWATPVGLLLVRTVVLRLAQRVVEDDG